MFNHPLGEEMLPHVQSEPLTHVLSLDIRSRAQHLLRKVQGAVQTILFPSHSGWMTPAPKSLVFILLRSVKDQRKTSKRNLGWIAPFCWTRDQHYFFSDGAGELLEVPVWIQWEFPKMTLGCSTPLQPKYLLPLGHTLLSKHQLHISSEWLCHHLSPLTRICPKKSWKLPEQPAKVRQF